MKRVALYKRVSGKHQEDEGSSLETQEAKARTWAEANGVEVVGVYQDVWSGNELYGRPALEDLRARLRSHDGVDGMLVYDIDRLSRHPAHLGALLVESEEQGYSIDFVHEPPDNSPEGQFMLMAKGFVGQIERQQIRERSMRAIEAKIKSGRLPGRGRAAYGYAWNEKRDAYVLDTETAPIVRRIFDHVLGGNTLRGIATLLNREGIPAPQGGELGWSGATILQIIKNPIYTGTYFYNRKKGFRHRNKDGRWVWGDERRPESEWIRIEDAVPAIVSQKDFDAVKDALARNSQVAQRHNQHPQDYLLRGYVYCAECGYPMYADGGMAKGQHVNTYRCRRPTCEARPTIFQTKLDREVWAVISRLLGDPDHFREQVIRKLHAPQLTGDYSSITSMLDKIAKKQARLVKRLGDVDDEEIVGLIKHELAGLSASRVKLQSDLEAVEKQIEINRSIVGVANQISIDPERTLAGLDFEDKQKAFKALRVRVRVYPGYEDPRWEIQTVVPIAISPSTRGYRNTSEISQIVITLFGRRLDTGTPPASIEVSQRRNPRR